MRKKNNRTRTVSRVLLPHTPPQTLCWFLALGLCYTPIMCSPHSPFFLFIFGTFVSSYAPETWVFHPLSLSLCPSIQVFVFHPSSWISHPTFYHSPFCHWFIVSLSLLNSWTNILRRTASLKPACSLPTITDTHIISSTWTTTAHRSNTSLFSF